MRWIKGAVAACCLLLAAPAWGQDCQANVVSVNFGEFDAGIVSPVDAVGEISARCTAGIPYSILIDAGQHSRGSFSPRKMQRAGGSATLNYNLYTDSARTRVWGDGNGATFVQRATATGGPDRFTVFGRIPAGQNVVPGLFSDTLTVTVLW